MFLADAMGFLNFPGQLPIADKGLKLDLVHVTSVFPMLKTMEEVLADHAKFSKTIIEQGKLTIIRTGKDLLHLSATNAIVDLPKETGVLMGMQNTPKDPDAKALFEAGIRVITLAYQGENDLGSGWINAGIGLKAKGVDFVRECARYGVILDLSHLGHQTARDVVKIAKEEKLSLSIMASHGGCYGQYHHMRNLPDDILVGVAETGGVVGIALLTFALDEEKNDGYFSSSFLRHLYHAVKICGEEAVAIGSDAPYVKEEPTIAEEKFLDLLPKLDPRGILGARFPEYIFTGPNLMGELWLALQLEPEQWQYPRSSNTLSSSTLDSIFGLNFFNFLLRALPES